jgi:hypothetical protein
LVSGGNYCDHNTTPACYTTIEMAKSKPKQQTDGAFVLKLVLYVILGSLWLKIHKDGANFTIPLPVGLLVGLLFSSHEHFRIDRKIEYGVLVVAALLGMIAPYGLFISM